MFEIYLLGQTWKYFLKNCLFQSTTGSHEFAQFPDLLPRQQGGTRRQPTTERQQTADWPTANQHQTTDPNERPANSRDKFGQFSLPDQVKARGKNKIIFFADMSADLTVLQCGKKKPNFSPTIEGIGSSKFPTFCRHFGKNRNV